MWPSTVCRSDSAARYTSSWVQPVRSARIRICPADSSPDTYSARRPAQAQRCTTSSSSVDLPTPGFAGEQDDRPGHDAPAEDPVEFADAGGQVAGVIRVDGADRHRGRRRRNRAAGVPSSEVSTAASSTVPQVPHSGQRPTHLAVTWWHSEQRYCERGRGRFGHAVTVSGGSDRSPRTRRRAATTRVSGLVLAGCVARRDRHRQRGLAGLLEGEGEVVGQAVADRLGQRDGWRRRRRRLRRRSAR